MTLSRPPGRSRSKKPQNPSLSVSVSDDDDISLSDQQDVGGKYTLNMTVTGGGLINFDGVAFMNLSGNSSGNITGKINANGTMEELNALFLPVGSHFGFFTAGCISVAVTLIRDDDGVKTTKIIKPGNKA